MVVLALLNVIAFVFMVIMLVTLPKRFKRIFLVAMVLPMVIWLGVAFAYYPQSSFGFTEVLLMLLRGSYLLGVASGALSCYIATKLIK